MGWAVTRNRLSTQVSGKFSRAGGFQILLDHAIVTPAHQSIMYFMDADMVVYPGFMQRTLTYGAFYSRSPRPTSAGRIGPCQYPTPHTLTRTQLRSQVLSLPIHSALILTACGFVLWSRLQPAHSVPGRCVRAGVLVQ